MLSEESSARENIWTKMGEREESDRCPVLGKSIVAHGESG